MTMPSYLRIFATTAICLIGMLLSSCHHRFNFMEQLDAEDKRVPIISHNKTIDEFSTEVIYLYEGNYYCKIPVAYAKESAAIMTRKFYDYGEDFGFDSDLLLPRSYTDVQKWETYYFPLSDAEVDRLLKRPKGTTKQPLPINKASVLSASVAADMQPIKLRGERVRFPIDSIIFAACDKENYCYRICNLPEQEGTRTLSQKLLLVPACALDTVGNAACIAIDIPEIVVVYPTVKLLEWMVTPFIKC